MSDLNMNATVVLSKTNEDGFLDFSYSFELCEIIKALNDVDDVDKYLCNKQFTFCLIFIYK